MRATTSPNGPPLSAVSGSRCARVCDVGNLSSKGLYDVASVHGQGDAVSAPTERDGPARNSFIGNDRPGTTGAERRDRAPFVPGGALCGLGVGHRQTPRPQRAPPGTN